MSSSRQISFGAFSLDTGSERLLKGAREIAVRPKVFAVLKYLLDNPERLITKDEILDAVWPEVSVGDAVLKSCIKELRDLLEDDPRSPSFIETVHRRGYRFIGDVASGTQPSEPASFVAGPRQPGVVVGRESQLVIMKSWLGKARRGERQVGLISGEPGIGKTTLVETFLRQYAKDSKTLIARGQCLEQYGEREAYQPMLEALSLLCRQAGGESLTQLIRHYAPMWLAQMPSLVDSKDREALHR